MHRDAGPADPIPAARHLHDDLTFLLVKLGRLAAARYGSALAEEGLRPPHYGLLIALDELGVVPQSAIAEALHTDRSHVVGLLDDLEQLGYVTRMQDPADRRRHAVGLTDAGREALQRCRRLAGRCEAKLYHDLDAAEQDQLRGLLQRVARANDLQHG